LKKYAEGNDTPIPDLEAGVMEVLMNYDRSGNIKELAYVIERAVVFLHLEEFHLNIYPKR